MTWVLLIGAVVAITGFPTKEACLDASKHVRISYTLQCVPIPANGTIILGAHQ